MKTYTIINKNKVDDSFNVKAENEESAAFTALHELGWIVLSPEDNQKENPDQYEFEF